MPPTGKEKKTFNEAATRPFYESDSEQSQENDVVQIGEEFSAFGEKLAISFDEEDSTNFMAI